MENLHSDKLYMKNPDFGPKSKAIACSICMNSGLTRRHRHHSTQAARSACRLRGSLSYRCPSCKLDHAVTIPNIYELNVVVTSSTLYDAFIGTYKSTIHYDLVSICGATMAMLRKAFLDDYRGAPVRLNVLVVAGLNDITRTSVEDFKREMLAWYYDMKEQNVCMLPDRLGFCEMMRPPQRVWLPGNGQPPPNHVFYNDKVNAMNGAIREVNSSIIPGHNTVSFVNQGRRTLKSGLEKHQWASWREQDKTNMLHQKNLYRYSMLKRLESCFKTWENHPAALETTWPL